MPYSGNPEDSAADAVRFIIGDTAASPKFSDDEIVWLLAQNGDDVYKTALAGAIQLQQSYTKKSKKSVGDLSISYSEAAEGMNALIEWLTNKVEGTGADDEFAAVGWMDGIDTSNLREPAFRIGMHDIFPQAPLDPDLRRDGSPYDPA